VTGDTLGKRIIGMLVVVALLAILCTQSVAAQVSDVYVYIWTDKPQYKPGEKGTLKISVLNNRTEPIEIRNITIIYPWYTYDAEKGQWIGNATIKLEPAEMLASSGGKYYKPVEFTIPSDGRVIMGSTIHVAVGTSKGIISENVGLSIAAASFPMSIENMDVWMTSLTVAMVICTIILAIVIFLSTRRAREPRMVAPPPKAKAE
jgi:hypothetical protein